MLENEGVKIESNKQSENAEIELNIRQDNLKLR